MIWLYVLLVIVSHRQTFFLVWSKYLETYFGALCQFCTAELTRAFCRDILMQNFYGQDPLRTMISGVLSLATMMQLDVGLQPVLNGM